MKKIFVFILTTIVCLSCKEVKIPVPTSLFLEENPIEASANGDTKTFEVQTNTSALVLNAADVNWCATTLSGTTLSIVIEQNSSLAARETSFELVVPDRSLVVPVKQSGMPTVPITIVDAWASSFQPGNASEGEVKYSYDGNMSTMYHSKWGEPSATYELIYYLKDAPTLALISYYPRTNGGNGTFGKIEIYASTVSDPENFKKIMDYDCEKKATASHIELTERVANAYAAKIIVDGSTSKGGFASCAEIGFYGVN